VVGAREGDRLGALLVGEAVGLLSVGDVVGDLLGNRLGFTVGK